MRTLKALSANPWMAKFGTAWMAVAFVLVSVCGAVAALWRSKLASAFLGLSSHRLLFLVVVLALSAALVAGYEFLRKRTLRDS